MTPQKIINAVVSQCDGVIPKASWGETALFYNPNNVLPNGVYFCTLKEKNGENDKASNLYREGVFRLSIGLGKVAYESLFGARPPRPSKGGIITTGHDFAECNVLMPHPIYGWMAWAQILNPSEATFADMFGLIINAHGQAVVKFDKNIAKRRAC
jgi:hypothetical protein